MALSAKHRYISTAFWDDSYILTLDPSEKLIFLYLLTNPLTNLCGVYQISTRRIAFDTGFDETVVVSILGRFEKDEKCIHLDGWLAMRNWLKHQSESPKVQSGIEMQLKEVPEYLSKYARGYSMDTISHLILSNPILSRSNLTEVSTPPAVKRITAPRIEYNPETGLFKGISDKQVDLWANAYPALEIETQLAKASAWLQANPSKIKKNYARFLVNWLARAQERGGDRAPIRR